MSNAPKYRKKAVEYEQLKQFDRAVASYVRAIEENENASEDVDVALFNKVGDLTLRQGRVTEAVTYYERAVEHYVSNNLYDNAIALCNKILRNAPGRSNVYFSLGRICGRKGLRSDATRNFLEYATRMQQEGRVDEGMRALAEVADLMPELTEVRRLVEEHAARAGISLTRRRETPVRTVAEADTDRMRSFGMSKDLVFLEIDYDAIKPVRGKTPPPQRSVLAESSTQPEAANASLHTAPVAAPTVVPVVTPDVAAPTMPVSAQPSTSRLEDLMIFDPGNGLAAPRPDDLDAVVVDGASILKPYVDPETLVASLEDLEPTELTESSQQLLLSEEPLSDLLQRGVLPDASTEFGGDEQLVRAPVKTGPKFPAITPNESVVALDGVESGISSMMLSEAAAAAPAEVAAHHQAELPAEHHVTLPITAAVELQHGLPGEGSAGQSVTRAQPSLVEPSHVEASIAEQRPAESLQLPAPSVETAGADAEFNEAFAATHLVESELVEPVFVESELVDTVFFEPEFVEPEVVEPVFIEPVFVETRVDQTERVEAPLPNALTNNVADDASAPSIAELHAGHDSAPLAALVSDVAMPPVVEPLVAPAVGTIEQEFDSRDTVDNIEGFTADDEPVVASELQLAEPISELVIVDLATALAAPSNADILPSLDFDAMLTLSEPEIELVADLDIEEFEPLRDDVGSYAFVQSHEASAAALVDAFESDLELPPLVFPLATDVDTQFEPIDLDGESRTSNPDAIAGPNRDVNDQLLADPFEIVDEITFDNALTSAPEVVELGFEIEPLHLDFLAPPVVNDEAFDIEFIAPLQNTAFELPELLDSELPVPEINIEDGAPADELIFLDVSTPDAPALMPVAMSVVDPEPVADGLDDLFGVTGLHTAVAAAEAAMFASTRCAELQSASDADPENFVLRRRLAEALFEAGNRDAAISELAAALAGAELANQLSEAAAIADELVHVNGDDVAHHQKRLELAIRLGDQSRLRDAYLDLADTLVRRGEDLRARAVYARVLEIDPFDDRARTALGDAAPPPPSRPAAPASDEGHVNLADWLRDDAEPTSTRLRMREPDVTGDEQDDFNALLKHFKEGVSRSLGEDDYESHYDLGVAYKEMGLLDDAIGEFQMALRSRNNRLAAYEALGQCFLEQQSYKVAVTVLSRALHEPAVQDEQRVGILYLLGYSCEVLQRFDEARGYFQRVYATDIHFRDVAQRLADLERTVR